MEQIIQFISNHWGLWLALVIVLLSILINEYLSQRNRAKELTTAGAIEKINHENATVIDLRDQDTFRSGHIIDAIQCSTDDFNQKRMEKYKTKPIILVCARGLQSAALATKLREQGFSQPMVLAGGISAWQSASLPLVKGKSSPTNSKRPN